MKRILAIEMATEGKRSRHAEMEALFISHGLAAVKYISDRTAVMYLGKIVEMGPTDEIFKHAMHPYTESLLSAIPIPDPTLNRDRIILKGDMPNPIYPPSGCCFHTRCRYAEERCSMSYPEWQLRDDGHGAACHFPLN